MKVCSKVNYVAFVNLTLLYQTKHALSVIAWRAPDHRHLAPSFIEALCTSRVASFTASFTGCHARRGASLRGRPDAVDLRSSLPSAEASDHDSSADFRSPRTVPRYITEPFTACHTRYVFNAGKLEGAFPFVAVDVG